MRDIRFGHPTNTAKSTLSFNALALFHALANIAPSFIGDESFMSKFLKKTASLPPVLRGQAIESDPFIATTHKELSEQFMPESSSEDPVEHHYTTFIVHNEFGVFP